VSAAASTGRAMLELDGVSAGYGPVQALSAVSVRVMPGEIVTLIGANGAGKSTLLMTICGDPKPRAGRIVLEGKDIAGLPTHAIMRLGLAQSPEGRRVFPRMTVNENLVMGAETLGNGGDRSAVLEEVFALFPRLRERLSQRAGTLSGGEQQMLAIGRALMSRPRLLLLDEPSLGLAPLIVRQIFAAIRDLNARTGLTVLIVEQNANLALRLAHRGYVLVNGRIAMEGTGAELLARPEVRDAYLGGGAPLPPGAAPAPVP
jgi:branched-chain amino acid transport system ATP-binding protein